MYKCLLNVSGFEPKGRGFESCRARQTIGENQTPTCASTRRFFFLQTDSLSLAASPSNFFQCGRGKKACQTGNALGILIAS